jgi:uncharacterized protein (DUF1778 family)
MLPTTPKNARLTFRLSADSKELIEAAAVVGGQSVSDYVIATLVSYSQTVLQQTQMTVLSNRDRKTFMALLDDADARPNRVLTTAATRYKKRFK